jgi:hypothetical protein
MDIGGVFSFALIGVATLVFVAGGIGLLVVLALRRDGIDDGSRAPAIYLSLVAIAASFTIVAGVTATVGSLAQIGADDTSDEFAISADEFTDEFTADEFTDDEFTDDSFVNLDSFGEQDADDAAIASAVQAALITVLAAAVLWFHRSLLAWAAALDPARSGGRIFRAYSLFTCLVAVSLVLFGTAAGAYDLFTAAAPGVTGTAERADGIRSLLPMVALVASAVALFRFHWITAGIPSLVAPADAESPAEAAPPPGV